MVVARARLSPNAAAVLRRKETLLLARTHLENQLRASANSRHRAMLQRALADWEKEWAVADALASSLPN